MNLDDFGRVNSAVLGQLCSLLDEWYPKGEIRMSEFCIGSVFGEAGQSLRIRIANGNEGIWKDFSSGEGGNDLISLYAAKEGISQGKACIDLAGKFGIELTPSENFVKRKGARGVGLKAPAAQPAEKPAPAPIPEPIKQPRTEWVPVLPVPADAGAFPAAHPVRGRPEKFWEYRNEDGQLLGVVYRFITSDGGKEVLPCVYARHPATGRGEWRWISFRNPRPLYLRGRLRPDLCAVIVEGEKCVDALFALIGDDFDVVSWPGGGNAATKADWSALAGRHVFLWADADAKFYKAPHPQAGLIKPEVEQPGMAVMNQIAKVLRTLGCNVQLIDIPPPGDMPDGWDVADLIEGGADAAEVLSWLQRLRPDQENVAVEVEAVVPGADQLAPPLPSVASPFPPVEEEQSGVSPDMGTKKQEEPVVPTGKKKKIPIKPGIPPEGETKEQDKSGVPPDNATPGPGKGGGNKKKVERPQSFWDAIDHLLEHFVLLYGTNTAWDQVNQMQIKITDLRYAYGADAVKFWLGNASRRMINIRQLVFDPTMTCPEECVNIFRGFEVQPKQGACDLILDLLAHLCDGDVMLTEWILRWIAYPLQHPGAKMASSIIMHGDEGSGKNLFWERVVRRIYGEYGGIIGNAQIESQFNEWASKKLFFVADEVVTRNEIKQLKGRLKTMVSGEEITVNPKNLPERYEANHMNFVFLSNELKPLELDKTDRRYLVVWTPDKKNKQYYKDVFTQIYNGGMEAFYHYLLHKVDCSDFSENTDVLETKAKSKLILLGLSAPERFYREWAGNGLPLPFMTCGAMQLYAAFQRWSHLNGERYPPTQTEFGAKIERMAAGEVTRKLVKFADAVGVNKQRTAYLVGAKPEGKSLADWVEACSALFEKDLKQYRHVYDQSNEIPSNVNS